MCVWLGGGLCPLCCWPGKSALIAAEVLVSTPHCLWLLKDVGMFPISKLSYIIGVTWEAHQMGLCWDPKFRSSWEETCLERYVRCGFLWYCINWGKNGIEQWNPAIAKSAKFILSVASIAVKALLAYKQYIQGVKNVPWQGYGGYKNTECIWLGQNSLLWFHKWCPCTHAEVVKNQLKILRKGRERKGAWGWLRQASLGAGTSPCLPSQLLSLWSPCPYRGVARTVPVLCLFWLQREF